jgi:N-glycosylase/DNA lyase
MKLTIPVPSGFNLWSTIHSHGWSVLPPFETNVINRSLKLIVPLSSGNTIPAEIKQQTASSIDIYYDFPSSLRSAEKKELSQIAKVCLRIDEDYSGFYREAKSNKQYHWITKHGAGRMLRAPTMFEDTVKMMCTTNCSWALTETMVKNLCEKLGTNVNGNRYTFPAPGAIADVSEKFLRKEIRAGYRSPYLLELSRRIIKNEIYIESWRDCATPTEELFAEVRSVKGIGPYAAGNLLKLLGRYDYLGIDSWCRKKFSEIYKKGRKVSDKTIERHYDSFGKWRGLFFWMDVTKHWYITGAST